MVAPDAAEGLVELELELGELEALGVGDAVAGHEADVGKSTLLALHRLLAVLMMARGLSAGWHW